MEEEGKKEMSYEERAELAGKIAAKIDQETGGDCDGIILVLSMAASLLLKRQITLSVHSF